MLLKRKGFVRVALEAGASLVPALCFGENEQVSGTGRWGHVLVWSPSPLVEMPLSARPHAPPLICRTCMPPKKQKLQYHRIFVRPGSLVDRLQAFTKKVGNVTGLRPASVRCMGCWTCCACWACCPLWAPPESRAATTHPTAQYGGFTLPLAYGRGILGLKYGPLPERDPLTTVVGAPVALPPFHGGRPLGLCALGMCG